MFAHRYNLVLNLLYTRTLDEAKAFIDRSFDNYLGMHPRRPPFVNFCNAEIYLPES